MEKFSQFRDRGSGIAPFLPVPSEPAGLYLPFHILLFIIRVPLILGISILYAAVLQWLPYPLYIQKGVIWTILIVQGAWWQDLQIDGVRRGSLSRNESRLPGPGSIIAASSTSPLDALYLTAIFSPIFTLSYPRTRLVQPVSLLTFLHSVLTTPQLHPPKNATLIPLSTLLRQNSDRVVVVTPECTTTNGRAILQPSPSLLSAPTDAKIFPVSLRYTPQDITTPVPNQHWSFLWRACAKPAHGIRVRIAECIYNNVENGVAANGNGIGEQNGSSGESDEGPLKLSAEERKVLDRTGEALARLGRVKRVALGVENKVEFIHLWKSRRR